MPHACPYSLAPYRPVYHVLSATRSRNMFDLIFWSEDHFWSQKTLLHGGFLLPWHVFEQYKVIDQEPIFKCVLFKN